MFVNVLVVFLIFNNFCNGQTGDDLKALKTMLFTTNAYRKDVRPNIDQTKPTQIFLDLYLVGLNGIDEVSQKLTTTGFLYTGWQDDYLVWSPASYGGIATIQASQSDIWKPDIAVQNGFAKLKELGDNFINARIYNTGEVTWLPFEVFETKCAIDIRYFPFDQQTCNLIFVVWTSNVFEVNVTQGSKGAILYNFQNDGVWSIESTSVKTSTETAESMVTFTLILKRGSSYYVLNVIIPVILLGILNVLTFVLPADSGEKIGYTITVFLSFSVFLTIISSELPRTSGSILGYYLIFQLVMGTVVVLITAFELRFHHKKDPVPQRLLRCFSRKNVISDSTAKTADDQENTDMTWSDIISTFDMIMFFISSFLLVIATLIILLMLSMGHR